MPPCVYFPAFVLNIPVRDKNTVQTPAYRPNLTQTCLCKLSPVGTQAQPILYVLFMAALMLQRRRGVVVKDTI